MSENIFFAAFFFPSAAAVLVYFMKYLAAIKQARVRVEQDEAYRELAMRMAASQAEMASALTVLTNSLADVHMRMEGLEKILKEVE
jgi:chromatin segregation and condensation protein Rec8/ScpA/Scc1 (kleisin family)